MGLIFKTQKTLHHPDLWFTSLLSLALIILLLVLSHASELYPSYRINKNFIMHEHRNITNRQITDTRSAMGDTTAVNTSNTQKSCMNETVVLVNSESHTNIQFKRDDGCPFPSTDAYVVHMVSLSSQSLWSCYPRPVMGHREYTGNVSQERTVMHCPESEMLDPEVWNVTVSKFRSLKKPLPAPVQEEFDKTTTVDSISFNVQQISRMLNATTFAAWQEYFNYEVILPAHSLLFTKRMSLQESTKAANTNSSSSKHDQIHTTRCPDQPAPAGSWQHINNNNSILHWTGTPDPYYLYNNVSTSRGMFHIFNPFNCTYHFYTKQEAISCVQRTNLTFMGDSRLFNTWLTTKHWLESNDTIAPFFLDIRLPFRIGAGLLLHTHLIVDMTQNILDGKTVVMNTLVHDMADFWPSMTAGTARQLWLPSLCLHCADNQTLGDCNCIKKHDAIPIYIDRIKQIAQAIENAQAQRRERGLPLVKVYWVSQSNRAPVKGATPFAWQTMDLITSLEDAAADVMTSIAGAVHVDYRPHLKTAPPQFWDDHLHYLGCTDKGCPRELGRSFMKHLSLQILLNTVCN